jgi:hypothetical protein
VFDPEGEWRWIVGFAAFFAGLVTSRWLGDRAFRRLSGAERAAILDSSVARPGRGLLLPAVVSMSYHAPLPFWMMVGGYVLPVAAWSAYKLVRLGVSRGYVRTYLAAQSADLLGLVVFFLVAIQRLGAVPRS